VDVVSDPQIWTVIAVMSAVFIGTLRLNLRSLGREMQSSIAALDTRIAALDAKVDAHLARLDAKIDSRFEQLDAKIDERSDRLTDVMNARFTDVDHRLTTVEGDLGLVKGHLIGQRSA
jgi:hypothetical protein